MVNAKKLHQLRSKGIINQLKSKVIINLDMNVAAFCEYFVNRIRRIMIKEKSIMIENNNFELYDQKWVDFRNIYEYHGPDIQII